MLRAGELFPDYCKSYICFFQEALQSVQHWEVNLSDLFEESINMTN